MKHREYTIRESFPVGEMGVGLMESNQSPKEYRTYLYPSEDMYTSMEEKVFSTREDADSDYFQRCDQLIEQYEKKTGKPFPLPSYCTSVLKSSGDLVFLRRGMTGYYPSPFAKKGDRAGERSPLGADQRSIRLYQGPGSGHGGRQHVRLERAGGRSVPVRRRGALHLGPR